MRTAPVAQTGPARPAEQLSELQPQGNQQETKTGTDHKSRKAKPKKGKDHKNHSNHMLKGVEIAIYASGFLSLKKLPLTLLEDTIIAELRSFCRWGVSRSMAIAAWSWFGRNIEIRNPPTGHIVPMLDSAVALFCCHLTPDHSCMNSIAS